MEVWRCNRLDGWMDERMAVWRYGWMNVYGLDCQLVSWMDGGVCGHMGGDGWGCVGRICV